MAYMKKVANLYQSDSVKTASPAKLTLMLYDGAIKFCNIAIEGIDEKNIEKTNTNMKKAENIIVELRTTLDKRYPVWEEFDTVYDYIYRRMVEGNMKKDKEILQDAMRHLKTMRDTWKEVMRINNVS